jgi:hypothetical protein
VQSHCGCAVVAGAGESHVHACCCCAVVLLTSVLLWLLVMPGRPCHSTANAVGSNESSSRDHPSTGCGLQETWLFLKWLEPAMKQPAYTSAEKEAAAAGSAAVTWHHHLNAHASAQPKQTFLSACSGSSPQQAWACNACMPEPLLGRRQRLLM